MTAAIKHLSLSDALALIDDPQVARIAEYLWVVTWGNSPETKCEFTLAGDGQWNYCMDDAVKLNELFKEMLKELGSA